MNLCCSNSFAVGLRSGSFIKQEATKSLKSRLYWVPSNLGAGALGIKKSTFIGWILAFGGSPCINSIAVIPRDQMSALKS